MPTTNEEKNASPKHPFLTDKTASYDKRKRFRRIKSAPPGNSSTYNYKSTYAPKPLSKSISNHLYTNYQKLVVILITYLVLGTLCFYFTRHQISGKKTNHIVDALYFTIVTMTSVGYGDLAPASTLTVLMSCLFVVLGILIVGFVISKGAASIVEKQERMVVKALGLHKTIDDAEILKRMKTKNRVRNKCIMLMVFLLVIMATGTGLLLWIEDLDFVNAFYCVIGSLTGLGYIHTCFSTKSGRVFALFWILVGTAYVAQLLFTFALLHTERKQRLLVKYVLKRKTTVSDLEAADFDGDGIVVAAEFIVYKLKEMGKINEDDITPIMDEFETLDFNNSGTLSAADLMFSQASLPVYDLIAPQILV